MSVILVTGSNGQLGNELRVLSANYVGYEFLFTDVAELDITDKPKVKEFVNDHKPDWIINCAAYNLVDKAESEPDIANLINCASVGNLAESIKNSGCRLIHVSTDYVFDGRGFLPLTETTIPEPLSAYAKSKLCGEKEALSHHASMVIRTSWLYSSFGNNFVKTIIRKGREQEILKVVFDQVGTPTYAADLASAIMKIISGVIRNQLSFAAGIYNYSNEGVCSWYDFAAEIIKETGISCKVQPILSHQFLSAARRPFYSVLDKSKIKETYELEIPHWRESLINCIKLIM